MDAAWPRRMLWRRRGAWMWPTFVLAVVADAIIGHALPPSGDSETAVAAAIAGLVLNTLGVIVLSFPLAALIRRRRRDLPMVVARDYAGTAIVAAVTVVLLGVGLSHHSTVTRDASAQRDAIVRAQAYIGDRAPDVFRRNLQWVSVYPIEPGSIYRACVPSVDGLRTYCVIVNTRLPLARSVTFSGYEPNSLFSEGVN